MRIFSDKRCRENRNTHFVLNGAFFKKKSRAVYMRWCGKLRQKRKPERPQTATQYGACVWQATNTHSGYVILTAFFTATEIARTHQIVTLYVCCLSCYKQYGQCTLRSMKWAFKWNRLCFVLDSVTCQKNNVIHHCNSINRESAAGSTEVFVCLSVCWLGHWE